MQPVRRLAPRRTGFSLIELLVVITIILVIIGLIVSYLGQTGTAAREAATRATLAKLDALLQARYRQMLESFAEQDRKSSARNEWTNIAYSAMAVGGSEPMSARKAMVKLNRYRGAFPQRKEDFANLGGSDLVNPNASGWPGTMPASHLPETESSELLFYILTRGGGTGAEGQILDSINPRHIQDTDKDGLKEFVDDWGVPLRFYHSPTRLLRPGGAYVSTATAEQESIARALMPSAPARAADPFDFSNLYNQDPFDPRGALRTSAFASPIDAADRYYYPAPVTTFEGNYHTPDTYFAPLIVSCGADESLGLYEPAPAATSTDPLEYRHARLKNAEEAGDNLTNLQSVGGR